MAVFYANCSGEVYSLIIGKNYYKTELLNVNILHGLEYTWYNKLAIASFH